MFKISLFITKQGQRKKKDSGENQNMTEVQKVHEKVDERAILSMNPDE